MCFRSENREFYLKDCTCSAQLSSGLILKAIYQGVLKHLLHLI